MPIYTIRFLAETKYTKPAMAPNAIKPTFHMNFSESEIFLERLTSIIAAMINIIRAIIPNDRKTSEKG